MSQDRESRTRMILLSAVLLGGGFIGACNAAPQLSVDLDACWHIDGSRWECPDSLGSKRLLKNGQDIASATLVVTTTSGRKETIAIPKGVDAIFLTPGGLEILVQHYQLTDPTKAAGVTQYLAFARSKP